MLTKKLILDNGISLYFDPIKEAKTTGILIGVKIGSVFEEKSKRGISHLLEHMMFKSNRKYRNEEINKGFELNGGIVNALTSTYSTEYIVEVIPEKFGKVVDILFSMFDNDKFERREFELEKKVVLTEIERWLNDPELRLEDLSLKAVYGNSDYGEPIQGFRETVKSIEKEELEEFKYRYYTPDNMFIILSGKFKSRQIELVRKVFSKLEGKCAKKKPPSKGKGKNIKEKMQTKNQVYYSLNFKTKEDLHKIFAFQFFISRGLSSLLYQILREKYGIGYTLSFGCNEVFPDKESVVSLFIPGFEKEKEKVLKKAIKEIFDKLRKGNLEEYYKGRLRRTKLIYEKRRTNIFERLEEEGRTIYFYEENYDEFMKKVFKVPLKEIIEFTLNLKNGKEVKISS